MAETIDFVFRDFNTPGLPGSGEYEPEKPRIRRLLRQIQGGSGQSVTAPTLAALEAITPPNENYMGVVLDDPDAENNGYYYRQANAWVFGRGFPDTFARVELSGSGTAQTGAVNAGVSPADIDVFYAFVDVDNTGPLTLSINGEPPREVVNLAGNALAAGEWTGTVMFALRNGKYQLLLDAGSALSAAQSASEAADSAAEADASADSAAASAAAAGAASGRLVIGAFSELETKFVYSAPGSGQEAVANGDVITWPERGFAYKVAASGAIDSSLDYSGAGGVKLYVLGNNGDFYPEQVGAVGDYDPDTHLGTDDIEALELIQEVAHAAGGGRIVLKNVYGVTRAFKAIYPDVHFQGFWKQSGFGHLAGFVSDPPLDWQGNPAPRDAIFRALAVDRPINASWEMWQCRGFSIYAIDDTVTCAVFTGLVRGSVISGLYTFDGYDGIAISGCWSFEWSLCYSRNTANDGHVIGTGRYGVYNTSRVVNAATVYGNEAAWCHGWGLNWRGGQGNAVHGNTYERNKNNAWFGNIEASEISGNYIEHPTDPTDNVTTLGSINLKIGDATSGIVSDCDFSGNLIWLAAGSQATNLVIDGSIRNHFGPARFETGDDRDAATTTLTSGQALIRVFDNKFDIPVAGNISRRANRCSIPEKNITSNYTDSVSFEPGTSAGTYISKPDNKIENVPGSVATAILSDITYGADVTVLGVRHDSTMRFMDRVGCISFGQATGVVAQERGTPPSRTYSMSGNTLLITITGSAEFDVYVMVGGVV